MAFMVRLMKSFRMELSKATLKRTSMGKISYHWSTEPIDLIVYIVLIELNLLTDPSLFPTPH